MYSDIVTFSGLGYVITRWISIMRRRDPIVTRERERKKRKTEYAEPNFSLHFHLPYSVTSDDDTIAHDSKR